MEHYSLILQLVRNSRFRKAAESLRLSFVAEVINQLGVTSEELDQVKNKVYVSNENRNALFEVMKNVRMTKEQSQQMYEFLDNDLFDPSDLEKFADMLSEMAEKDKDIKRYLNIYFAVDGVGNEIKYRNYIKNLSALTEANNPFRLNDYHVAAVRTIYADDETVTPLDVYETLFKVINEEKGELADKYRGVVKSMKYKVIENVLKPKLTEESEMVIKSERE